MDTNMFDIESWNPDTILAHSMRRLGEKNIEAAKELMIDAKRLGYTVFYISNHEGETVFLARREADGDWIVKVDRT